MWFVAPSGVNGSISIQQNEYHPVVLSGPMVDGKPTQRVLYEVPEHYSHHLAALPGFIPCPAPDNLPEGYQSPVPNPESQTIEALASQVAFHKQQADDQGNIISLLQAKIETVTFDRDELRRELEETKTLLSNAQFELEQTRTPVDPPETKG
jgi:hypothetical protein